MSDITTSLSNLDLTLEQVDNIINDLDSSIENLGGDLEDLSIGGYSLSKSELEELSNNMKETRENDLEKFTNLLSKIKTFINTNYSYNDSTNIIKNYDTSYSSVGEGSNKFSNAVLYTSTNSYVTSLGFEKLAFPCANATILNKFMIEQDGVQHCGVDFRTDEGTNLFAVCDGVLTKTMTEFNGMILTASNGIQFRYLHCKTNKLIDKGLTTVNVSCGDVIGTAGSQDTTEENNTIYPHLHFDIFSSTPITNKYFNTNDGMVQDPEEFFCRAGMVLVTKVV